MIEKEVRKWKGKQSNEWTCDSNKVRGTHLLLLWLLTHSYHGRLGEKKRSDNNSERARDASITPSVAHLKHATQPVKRSDTFRMQPMQWQDCIYQPYLSATCHVLYSGGARMSCKWQRESQNSNLPETDSMTSEQTIVDKIDGGTQVFTAMLNKQR